MANVAASGLERLLHESNLADFTVACRTKEFKVHKVIICADSAFFQVVCCRPFKERDEKRVDLSVDSEDTVARLLLFLYTGQYDDLTVPKIGVHVQKVPSLSTTTSGDMAKSEIELAEPLTNDDEVPPKKPSPVIQDPREAAKKALEQAEQRKITEAIENNAQVYVSADRLDLGKLKKLAADKFLARIWSLADARDAYPALRLIFENTTQEHMEIRLAAMRYCIREQQRIKALPKLLALVQDCEPMAWTCAVEVQQRNKDLQMEKARIEARLSKAQEELDSVVQLVNGDRYMSGSRCTKADMMLDVHTNFAGTRQYRIACKCCNKRHVGVYITPNLDKAK